MNPGSSKAVSEVPPVWNEEELVGSQIDLLGALTGLVRRWPFIALMALAGGLLAMLISLILTPQFVSKAVFLPPPQQIPAADATFAALLKMPSNTPYAGLMQSQTVLADVVEHTDLQRILKAKDAEDARARLKRITTVATETSGFISVEVSYTDPKLAQQIASNYLAALARLNDRMSENSAAQQRRFYERELEREKDKLEQAELDLEKAQETSGVVLPQSQTQAGLNAINTIRAQIRLQQVRLTALLQSQTDQAPDVVLVRSQIAALESQLRELEASKEAPAGESLNAAKAPAVNREFVRLEREVKYHQTVFDAMAKQFENARIEESSAAPGVQVVDYPEVPLRKSWPPRTILTLVGMVLGALLALAIVFVSNRLEVLHQNPRKRESMRALREAFSNSTVRL
jgi:uncharacterized protein involved in exopolysaccharide biosynthesis